jgi:hypothetical protein
MERNKLPLETRHLGVPSSVRKLISMPLVHSAQTMHLGLDIEPTVVFFELF